MKIPVYLLVIAYAFIIGLLAGNYAHASELEYYGVLEVEHLYGDSPSLNEKHNDAKLLAYTFDNGLTIGYGRYLNSFYDPSIIYTIGYKHKWHRLVLQGGVAAVTGYSKHQIKPNVAGYLVTPILSATFNVIDYKGFGIGPTYALMGIVETKGISFSYKW